MHTFDHRDEHLHYKPDDRGWSLFGSFANLDPNSDKRGGHIRGELVGHFEANQ